MAHIPYIDHNGIEKTFFIDDYLQRTLDLAKNRVKKKNWDYVCIISGLPGSGKSTLAKTIAKYCDPDFNVDQIAFQDKGKSGFIDISNRLNDFKSIILDESFASLNSKVSMTTEFLNIVNHLQLLRQKHLFIILCLPNFFDLGKAISIFRSSHLFVTYDSDGDRGSFLAFDRNNKRKLFILGHKFMDYNSVKANFHGRFTINNGIINEEEYDRRKREHLMAQEMITKTKTTMSEKIMKKFKQSIVFGQEISGLSQRDYTSRLKSMGLAIDDTSISKFKNDLDENTP